MSFNISTIPLSVIENSNALLSWPHTLSLRLNRNINKQKKAYRHRIASKLLEVEELKGIRVVRESRLESPEVEYLVHWKKEKDEEVAAFSWEPKVNLSADLIRDFDDKWWSACRGVNKDAIVELLRYGGDVLSKVVDENGRSVLHFAGAVGRDDICKILLDCGADPNLADKDGYTPLHMSAGYLHNHIVKLLLASGANPELTDDQGRTPLVLVEGLRDNLPATDPNSTARRIALEEVVSSLTDALYEILEPVAILDMRRIAEEREYLIQWPDGADDSWVSEKDLAADVKEDYERGMEYAEVEKILKRKKKGDEMWYLIKWTDREESSWEPEENIATTVIEEWERKREEIKKLQKEKFLTV